MPFNEHKLLKFLYEKESSEYFPINDLIKEDVTESEASMATAHLEVLQNQLNIQIIGFLPLFKGEDTIFTKDIKARITPNGRR